MAQSSVNNNSHKLSVQLQTLYSLSSFAKRQVPWQPSAYNCSHCLPLSFVGTVGGEQRSMTLCNGQGVAARVAEGALQGLVELPAS